MNQSFKPKLKWSLDNGEGEVHNLDKFRELDPLLRADILKDWLYDLTQEYNLALQQEFGSTQESPEPWGYVDMASCLLLDSAKKAGAQGCQVFVHTKSFLSDINNQLSQCVALYTQIEGGN